MLNAEGTRSSAIADAVPCIGLRLGTSTDVDQPSPGWSPDVTPVRSLAPDPTLDSSLGRSLRLFT